MTRHICRAFWAPGTRVPLYLTDTLVLDGYLAIIYPSTQVPAQNGRKNSQVPGYIFPQDSENPFKTGVRRVSPLATTGTQVSLDPMRIAQHPVGLTVYEDRFVGYTFFLQAGCWVGCAAFHVRTLKKSFTRCPRPCSTLRTNTGGIVQNAQARIPIHTPGIYNTVFAIIQFSRVVYTKNIRNQRQHVELVGCKR